MCASLDMEAGGYGNGNMAFDPALHPYMDPALGGTPYHDSSGQFIDAATAAQLMITNNPVLHQSFAPISSFNGGFSESYGWNDQTIAPPEVMNEPGTSESQPSENGESQAVPQVEAALSAEPAQPAKKSRKTSKASASSKTSTEQSNNGPSQARTRRQGQTAKKRNNSMKLESDEDLDDIDIEGYYSDDDDAFFNLPTGAKRNRLLERNRVAASKCRQKKKKWVNGLEEAKSDLETQHSNLQSEYKELLEEVNQMKNHLIAHAGCQDGNIDRWIGSEAQRFVDKTSLASDGSQAEGSAAQGEKRQSSGSGSEHICESPPASTQHHASPGSSRGALSSQLKFEDVNYNHMPDDLFEEGVVSPGQLDQ